MGVNPSFAKATEGFTMAKKKRKNRKEKRQRTIKTRPQKTEEPAPATVDVRSDLRKTALLTVVCLVILFALFLTQSR